MSIHWTCIDPSTGDSIALQGRLRLVQEVCQLLDIDPYGTSDSRLSMLGDINADDIRLAIINQIWGGDPFYPVWTVDVDKQIGMNSAAYTALVQSMLDAVHWYLKVHRTGGFFFAPGIVTFSDEHEAQ